MSWVTVSITTTAHLMCVTEKNACKVTSMPGGLAPGWQAVLLWDSLEEWNPRMAQEQRTASRTELQRASWQPRAVPVRWALAGEAWKQHRRQWSGGSGPDWWCWHKQQPERAQAGGTMAWSSLWQPESQRPKGCALGALWNSMLGMSQDTEDEAWKGICGPAVLQVGGDFGSNCWCDLWGERPAPLAMWVEPMSAASQAPFHSSIMLVHHLARQGGPHLQKRRQAGEK